MSEQSESLWKLLRQGDEQAWKKLFEDHYAVLCHFAFQFVRDRFTAEALVGDVFYTLWEKRSTLEIHESMRPYLLRAVRNRCLNHLDTFNSKRMQQFSSLPAGQLERILLEDYEGRLLELEDDLEKAVSQLPEHTRMVFEKSRGEHLKYEEIARQMGISVNTVKFHMKKALSLLRASLAKYLPAAVSLFMLFRA